jgi:serine protease Do
VSARPIADDRAPPVELYRADPISTRAGYTTELLESGGQQLSGARIVELFPESPLPSYGLRINDVILALNGQTVQTAQGFINSIHNRHSPGDTVTLTYVRDGRVVEQRVRLWDPGRRLSRLNLWPLVTYESSLVPDRTRLSIIDLWLFSLFTYQHTEGEKEYRFLGLFRVATGYGELLEERR